MSTLMMDVSHLVLVQSSSQYCATLFLPWVNPSSSAALSWDYPRASDKTSRVSLRWPVHILLPAIIGFLIVTWLAFCQLPSCSHVLFQLKCSKSTGARTLNQWPSVTRSPPTEGAKLTSLRAALSSARLMCRGSLVGRSQHASSMTVPFIFNATPVATDLASTQTVISLTSIRQFPPTGSASRTVVKVSANMWQREAFLILSSQPILTAVVRRLINVTATMTTPHSGKWPTSFPQRENTSRQVNPSGISGIWLSRFHRRLPSYSQTCKPRTPSLSHTGFLETKLYSKKCCCTGDAGTRLSSIQMSSTYTDMALLIVWSWETIASITNFIISDATFSPNRWPLKSQFETAIVPCRRGFEDNHFADLEKTHWLLVAAILLVSSRTLLHWLWKHPQNRSIPGSQAPDAPFASAPAPARPPLRELDPGLLHCYTRYWVKLFFIFTSSSFSNERTSSRMGL